ncbi:Spx/MgsR family RNA polymerase-binding regulatory protein [Segetibacter sp. 3557_3]|nr:Spx/MgsR family RNA polymerase-binding regulatory protein [Segetibacter sp. 3557_3]
MTLYGIPNCDSVKKAIVWLKQHDLPYQFHNYKTEGITKPKLREWCKHWGWEKVLNRKGTTWKALSAEQQAAINTEKTAIQFLIENTSAIRRPVLEYGNLMFLGFDEDNYQELLSPQKADPL